MIYNFRKLLFDLNIPYDDKEAIHRGYITVPCPFCHGQHNKFYGAIHAHKNFYICWKCGGHTLFDFFRIMSGENWYYLCKQYELYKDNTITREKEEKNRPTEIQFPLGTIEPVEIHKDYLVSRGFFDPDTIISENNLKGTLHRGPFKFRIIIPIYFQGQLVSYTSRDYSGESEIRYMSCKKELEIIDHKTIVYGFDAVPGNHVIVVEGPIDKWKMGRYSVALFGTGFKQNQVNILSSFKKVTILFDNEYEAEKNAEKLGKLLSGLGTTVEIIILKNNDPGELSQNEAEYLIKEIMN